MSHPSQTPRPRDGEQGQQFTGYGYGGQPIDPATGNPVSPPPPPPGWHPQYGYGPGPGYPRQEQGNSNGLGIASIILGIVGLALAWIPIINYIAMVLGLIALVLGGVGIFKSHRMMSISGAVLGLIAIVASFAVFASFANSVDQAVDDYNAAVDAAPPAPSLSSPATEECIGYGCDPAQDEELLEGEREANADESFVDDTPNLDNGWELAGVTYPRGSAYTFAEAEIINTETDPRAAMIELAVYEDGHLIGTLYGSTTFVPGESNTTVTLLPADLLNGPFDHEPIEANLEYVLTAV